MAKMSPECLPLPTGSGSTWSKPRVLIDTGPSVLLDAHVRSDFTAETALEALTETLRTSGRPQCIPLDRDARWVGSPAGSDFPAALLRFGACLGIEMHLCDPHHPAQNGCVERSHRS